MKKAILTEKSERRTEIERRLDTMSRREYLENSETVRLSVGKILHGIHEKEGQSSILSYKASLKWREVDLSPLEVEFPSGAFMHVPLSVTAPIPEGQYSVILVPLFGFNENNFRLGHGAGWYDRLLKQYPEAIKIGVGLEINRIEFAEEPHDIPLDMIVTEQEQYILQRKNLHQ